MTILNDDEKNLLAHLEGLPDSHKAAIAAACAQRLFPAYDRFSKRSGRGDPRALASILDRLWVDLEGNAMTSEEVNGSIQAAMELIPQEDDGRWIDGQDAAEDASAAIAYALRCRNTGKSQEAVWAAQRAFEAAHHFVIVREGIDVNMPGAKQRVLEHPLVQAELERQRRDLNELLTTQGEDMRQVVARLRGRAEKEAAIFFGPAL